MDDRPASPPDAIARFRRWAAIAVALASLGYLAYAVWRGLSETTTELLGFRWSLTVPILALTLVNYGLRYLKWHYLLGRLGIRIAHRVNAPIFTAGLAMVISPAKAGELVKPYLVQVCTGASMTRTLPALIAERATDGVAVILLAALGVGTYYAQATPLIWGSLAAFLVVLVLLSSRRLVQGGLSLLRRVVGLRRLVDRLDEVYAATRVCFAPVPLLLTTALSLVAWFAECIGYWLVFVGLGLDTSLWADTFLYAFATVFGAPSPGGMGMADVALTEGAVAILGVTAPQAVAASLLVRVATLWFGVLLGAFALLRMESTIAAVSRPAP